MTTNAEFGPSGPGDPDTSIVLDEHLGWRPWCSGRMNAAPDPRYVRTLRRDRASTRSSVATSRRSAPRRRRRRPAPAPARARQAETARTTEMTGPCSPLPIAIRRRQASGRRPAGGDEMQRLELAFVSTRPRTARPRASPTETWRRAGVPVRVLRLAGIRP